MANSKEDLVNTGLNYYYGKNDYPLNYGKAYAYFIEAAKIGSADAMNNIGVMYDNGQYVQKNANVAFEWFNRAVQTDPKHHLALHNLGRYYYSGAVCKDLGKAFEYYRAALNNGYDKRYSNYAHMCCYMGEILMYHFKYKKEAYWYFYEAAKVGNIAVAWHNLGWLAQSGDVPADSGIEPTRGKRVAAAKVFYEKAAALGFGQSMCDLGAIYVSINEMEQARYWFNKAVAAGYEPAKKRLKLLNYSQGGSLFDLMK